MKKILALFACLTLFTTAFFAEALDNNDFMAVRKFEMEKEQEVKIVPEEQHCVDKNANVSITYRPAYHEAHFYYDTLYVTYDKAEAMNTLIAVREDFMREYNYKHFTIQEETEKHRKAERGNRSTYHLKIKFTY